MKQEKKVLFFKDNKNIKIEFLVNSENADTLAISNNLDLYNKSILDDVTYLNVRTNHLCLVSYHNDKSIAGGLIGSFSKGASIAWIKDIWLENEQDTALIDTLVLEFENFVFHSGAVTVQAEVFDFQLLNRVLHQNNYHCIQTIQNFVSSTNCHFFHKNLTEIIRSTDSCDLITQKDPNFLKTFSFLYGATQKKIMIFFKVTSYEKLSVLLDVDDKIIGGMELEIYSPYSALKKVWLNEQYRRKGIMSSVMPYLIKNLQNKSVQNIAVGCIEETAWKSYEKNGFKLLGKIPKWLGDAEQIWGSLDIV